ncbi:MAG TPA: hypothetical protein VFW87_12220 [Pirellulales bacterium]|nr:hypothetical protein [Pirellulales bacterium]
MTERYLVSADDAMSAEQLSHTLQVIVGHDAFGARMRGLDSFERNSALSPRAEHNPQDAIHEDDVSS